jgi:hypothetical protein
LRNRLTVSLARALAAASHRHPAAVGRAGVRVGDVVDAADGSEDEGADAARARAAAGAADGHVLACSEARVGVRHVVVAAHRAGDFGTKAARRRNGGSFCKNYETLVNRPHEFYFLTEKIGAI